MGEGTERLLKQGQQHWRGQRAVTKRSKRIGGAREAANNRRKSVWSGQGRLTLATMLGSERLTTVDTDMDGLERLLTTRGTELKGAMNTANSRNRAGGAREPVDNRSNSI